MKNLFDLAKAAIESLRELRGATPHNETSKISLLEDTIDIIADDYGLQRCVDCREFFEKCEVVEDGPGYRCEGCIELVEGDRRGRAELNNWINRGLSAGQYDARHDLAWVEDD